MKIFTIGSHAYKNKIMEHAEELRKQGHEVETPAFDNHPDLDDLGICKYNLMRIKWAEEIHMFWDQRSLGTIADFFMAFALDRPVRIIYLEEKTIRGVMEKYEIEKISFLNKSENDKLLKLKQPHGYYYCKTPKKYSFCDENSNGKLSSFGIRNGLPCGGAWIKGNDFAFCIEYAADSYNHMIQVFEYGKEFCEKWNELDIHLSKYQHTMFTLKSRDQVAADLGILN